MSRPFNEHQFMSHDDTSIYYRHFPAQTDTPKGSIVLFHRGHEHSERMMHLVDELDLPDFEFFAWDARGHGRSSGVRGYSPSFSASVHDVQTFMLHLGAAHQVVLEDTFIIAQSVGAVLVSTWVHDYAPKIRGMSLASPAFDIKLYVPFAKEGLGLLYKLRGLFFVNSYVKAKFLTQDQERVNSYDTDPLITRPIAVNVLLGLYQAAKRVVNDAQAITTPVQLLISGNDWVVKRKAQDRFYANLASPIKSKHVLSGFLHDTLGEKDRYIAVHKIKDFVQQLFAQPIHSLDFNHADQYGYTADEARELSAELPPHSLRGIYWKLTRLSLKLGGWLSTGIRLGHQTGFDSGSTLDYVYRNQATGKTALGRLIDRQYLNSPGWRGIRQRKIHIEMLLASAIASLRATQKDIHILDIAAGHGRYIMDGVLAHREAIQSITLRDYSDINVQDGRRLIQEKGLQDIAQFIQADAFDKESIAQTSPKPTLAVVSGLYELFSDNQLLRTSLDGLAQAVPAGGYLIYTNQPWHPQLELIARALTSHRGHQAWVMRRRNQAEMDQLVEQVGFKKLNELIDSDGIFTVSLAQRL
ncbi:bifunctional alpha/beta hydrolase/class I SAM-dependent methyltransferase [Hydromonas duriensis]|uniref:Alpha-beta hydrolase superfamily lysophospholipase n=1 Tax=Hydromonas duriensis TaxID=1527608 RepID=A0A4R6YBR1_9BURK|nr:bifunctional alpha/beta hydrolase/class I SAM-dependent methyltransferase [Hydromonas duriensis]TDR33083.1 alpha-beta hydrolase superfamily lysophospholipase [Hydromonas duriensis]